MKWSPSFPVRKGKGAPVLQVGINEGPFAPSVWAGVSSADQTLAFASTTGSHRPLHVQVHSESICIGMHVKIARGQMARIVRWLRRNGVTVDVDANSPHAADLAALTAEAGEGAPA
ncbi:hypothetical protein [Pseudoxanthomonas sp. USHLN014]|uniref:hypothetical protein n=1 Tax=Pseudoxanthomonas sp. USHLN014 TaxID=3081297 RepID=UPI00301DEA68